MNDAINDQRIFQSKFQLQQTNFYIFSNYAIINFWKVRLYVTKDKYLISVSSCDLLS